MNKKINLTNQLDTYQVEDESKNVYIIIQSLTILNSQNENLIHSIRARDKFISYRLVKKYLKHRY